jgi:hypothetical protein
LGTVVAASPSLAPIRSGTIPGQCAACGLEDSAEWGVAFCSQRIPGPPAYLRLCDDCYRSTMEWLRIMPDRGKHRLKGYS